MFRAIHSPSSKEHVGFVVDAEAIFALAENKSDLIKYVQDLVSSEDNISSYLTEYYNAKLDVRLCYIYTGYNTPQKTPFNQLVVSTEYDKSPDQPRVIGCHEFLFIVTSSGKVFPLMPYAEDLLLWSVYWELHGIEIKRDEQEGDLSWEGKKPFEVLIPSGRISVKDVDVQDWVQKRINQGLIHLGGVEFL